jgi:hypothetical protein
MPRYVLVRDRRLLQDGSDARGWRVAQDGDYDAQDLVPVYRPDDPTRMPVGQLPAEFVVLGGITRWSLSGGRGTCHVPHGHEPLEVRELADLRTGMIRGPLRDPRQVLNRWMGVLSAHDPVNALVGDTGSRGDLGETSRREAQDVTQGQRRSSVMHRIFGHEAYPAALGS